MHTFIGMNRIACISAVGESLETIPDISADLLRGPLGCCLGWAGGTLGLLLGQGWDLCCGTLGLLLGGLGLRETLGVLLVQGAACWGLLA